MNCPICDSDTQKYPVLDAATGWRFCGDCYHAVRQQAPLHPSLSQWLRAIATVRDAHKALFVVITG